jgi:hypothetical protein
MSAEKGRKGKMNIKDPRPLAYAENVRRCEDIKAAAKVWSLEDRMVVLNKLTS